MSLHVPPLFERVRLFHEDGTDAGHALRRCRLQPGEVVLPLGSSIAAGIALIREVEDNARFD